MMPGKKAIEYIRVTYEGLVSDYPLIGALQKDVKNLIASVYKKAYFRGWEDALASINVCGEEKSQPQVSGFVSLRSDDARVDLEKTLEKDL